MTGRERIRAHLAGQPVDRLPVMPITMMFAGDLAGIPYGRYARDHRALVEAQVRTADAFDLDYVSAISDPAREAADCGAKVRWFENQPPAIDEDHARLSDKTELARLRAPRPGDGERMRDRLAACALFRDRLGGRRLIEGWVEGPCAEGADLRGINTLMVDFFDDPGFVGDLFAFAAGLGQEFARAQLAAGADLIGVGDAAASLVGPELYEEFVWPWEKRLVDGIHAAGGLVRLHICGNTRSIAGLMGRLGADIVDLDYPVPVAEARAAMGPDRVLLGNIDPVRVLREGTPASIAAAIAACHRDAGPRYIVGAGCEVPRGTPPANLRALTEYAAAHRPALEGRFRGSALPTPREPNATP